MKKLPPAKRNQLIMVVLATLAVLAGVYFFLIQAGQQQNEKLVRDTKAKTDELNKITTSIKQANLTDAKLTSVTTQLEHAEDDVITGDVFAWTYDTIRRFKANYHVDIPNVSQPLISEVDLVSGLPYKQVKVSLSGTAYYHDLGKFIADFENTFPHIRMVNLSIEPSNGSTPGASPEKLYFRVDVIALVKENT